jgi:antitoxin component YwqK of YwqJK toxin-antitoxin module
MKYPGSFLLILLIASCQPAGPSANPATTQTTDGYTLTPLEGTDLVQAIKKDAEGRVEESGYFLDNLMQGTWLYYDIKSFEFPVKIINYHRGVAQGLYLELNQQGNIELRAFYKNNQLHGPWGMYKFGRPVKTAFYENGVLNGTYREYSALNGRLQKEVNYLNGKEHGLYRYYNDNEEVTLEYVYENGEKVSGGIKETGNSNAPK